MSFPSRVPNVGAHFAIDDLSVGKLPSDNLWLDETNDDPCIGIFRPPADDAKTALDDFGSCFSSSLVVPPLFTANTIATPYRPVIDTDCGNSSPLSVPSIPSPHHHSVSNTISGSHVHSSHQLAYTDHSVSSIQGQSDVCLLPVATIPIPSPPGPAPRGIEERYGQNPTAPYPRGPNPNDGQVHSPITNATSPASMSYSDSNPSNSPYTYDYPSSNAPPSLPSSSTSPYSLAPHDRTEVTLPQGLVQLPSYPPHGMPVSSYATVPVHPGAYGQHPHVQVIHSPADANTPTLAPTPSTHTVTNSASHTYSQPSSGSVSPFAPNTSVSPPLTSAQAAANAASAMTTRSSSRRPRPSSGNVSPPPSASTSTSVTTRKRRAPASSTAAFTPPTTVSARATKGSSRRTTTLERTPSSGPSSDDEDNEHTTRNAKAQELVANSSAVRAAVARAAELTPIIIPGGDGEDDSALRRQRNKISASQYRKRRKVFVELLEEKVAEMEQTIKQQTEMLQQLQEQMNRQAQPMPHHQMPGHPHAHAHAHAHPHASMMPGSMPISHAPYPHTHGVPMHPVDGVAYPYPAHTHAHYPSAHVHPSMMQGHHPYVPPTHVHPQQMAPGAPGAQPHSAPATPPHTINGYPSATNNYYSPVVDEESSNVSRWAVRTAVMFAFFSCLLLMAIPPVYQTEEYGSTNTLVGYLGVPEFELDLDKELQTVQMWGRKLLAMDFDMSESSGIASSIVLFFSQFGLLGFVSWAQSWLHFVSFNVIGVDPNDPYLLWVMAIIFGITLLSVLSAWSFLVASTQDCGQRVDAGSANNNVKSEKMMTSKLTHEVVNDTIVCAAESVATIDTTETSHASVFSELSTIPEESSAYELAPEVDIDPEDILVYEDDSYSGYSEVDPLPDEDLSEGSDYMHNCTTEEEESGEVSEDDKKYLLESPERNIPTRARTRPHTQIEAF